MLTRSDFVRRFAIFVDGSNLYGTLKYLGVTVDDYANLYRFIFDKAITHATIFHLRLREGKILIEEDGVEHGITQDLLDAGVAPKDIVYSLEIDEAPALRKVS
jgi:hypothetical protein